MDIIVKPVGDEWGAFYNDKRIAKSKCMSCVVNAVLAVTKTSTRYSCITVLTEDGSIQAIFPTGVKNGRTAS